MTLAKLTLVNGESYIVSHSPKDVYQRVTHSDGKPKNHIHLLTLENGKELYINATYILSIEKVSAHTIGETGKKADEKEATESEDTNRIKDNLEAVKEFKEDIDGNME